ncbi:hypothetical protein [Wenyingzhuangia sp. 2_MG-2023]|uniref:hypothetical protein n=1 Tax=Wenyingzhuangia sp. 2_MG-2023 TaxID=3062639 RepID=UPI0026E311DF|nr:hypothetical protein [Wenyingzhuangia sp. 2_MG-2023]MDO6739437.1 hypothetical protein [Wenyingzhuangia sp. 2_MG-2023]
MEYSISHKRELTKYEIEFLTYLFENSKPEWVSLIPNLKVVARCGCGNCPIIIFDTSIEKKNLIIDFTGKSTKDELIGISVFGNEEKPLELEFWSIDGKAKHITEIPKIETLKPTSYNN